MFVVGWKKRKIDPSYLTTPLQITFNTHSPLVPRPLLLEVRNIAHDSAAEYRAYRGGYAPALLPFDVGEEGEGGGGSGGATAAAAVGAPM